MGSNDNEDGEDQSKSAAISKFGQNSALVNQLLYSMALNL